MQKPILYTFPMNKSVRLFMRYQHLMERFNTSRLENSEEAASTALLTLIELYELTSRGDLKADLLREVERIHIGQGKAGQEAELEPGIFEELKAISEVIADLRGQLGAHLKNHDFINAIRQKHVIPGGLNAFDLPVFQYWMHRPFEDRNERLEKWALPYLQFGEAVSRYMSVIYSHQVESDETAEHGFFAKTLDTRRNYHLLTIKLPDDSEAYPEPSLGRHRITLRFMRSDALAESSTQLQSPVSFTLITSSTA
ncbi:MAG: cell division protein ZapD [bacterium]